jgi:hypothetical protein
VEITPPVDADARSFMDVLSVNIKGGEKLAFTSLGYHSRK